MTDGRPPFEDAFAARVREVFDAYEEPVDEAALKRTMAALGAAPPARAADRPAAATALRGRPRWRWAAALAVLLVGVGLWWTLAQEAAPHEGGPPLIAERPRDTAPLSVQDMPAEGDRSLDLPGAAQETPSVPGSVPEGGPAGPDPARLTIRPGASAPGARLAVQALPPPRPAPSERLHAQAPLPDAEAASETSLAPPSLAALPAEAPTVRAGPPTLGGGLAALPAHPPRPALALTVEPPPPPFRPRTTPLSQTDVTIAALSGEDPSAGGGLALGLTVERQVRRGVALSSGLAATYGIRSIDLPIPDPSQSQGEVLQNPGQTVDVVSGTRITTLALEVPVDFVVDVARLQSGRVGVSAGVTSALYLAQAFDDEGLTYQARVEDRPQGPTVVVVTSPYAAQETSGLALDLASQLNLGVRFQPFRDAAPISGGLFVRLPLSGLTDRDLSLTTVGIRVGYVLR